MHHQYLIIQYLLNLSQLKKVYEHFTKKDVPAKLKDELTKVLQLKIMIISM